MVGRPAGPSRANAGMMESVDERNLDNVTSVKFFCFIIRCGHSSVKADSPVFINADQVICSAAVSHRIKSEETNIATESPAAHICGYGELADAQDLGAVALV